MHEDFPPSVRTTLSVRKLTFDSTLQCRVAVDQDVVAEYAEKMADGDVFPAIDVVNVDGKHLVVDGWHRAYAARKAKLKQIDVVITEGTRRDAILRAVSANNNHGLRRTHDDKRRAVQTLLQDAEWCRLSNRDLAKLAHVSHAFVGQTRRHYQLGKGEVLTADRVDEVDGAPPAEWVELADKVESYYRSDLLELRTCFTLTELEKRDQSYRTHPAWDEAFTLQLERIAARCGDPWPWSGDTDADDRAARLRSCVDALDLAAAVMSPDCPDRLTAFRAWHVLGHVETADRWTVDRWKAREAFTGWTGIHRAIDERLAELEEQRATRPPSAWDQARAIETIEDPDDQAMACRTASDDVRDKVRIAACSAAARSELRYLAGDVDKFDCRDLACDGWMRDCTYGEPRCTVCNNTATQVSEYRAQVLAYVTRQLHAGAHLVVDGRVLTAEVLAILPQTNAPIAEVV